MEDGVSRQVMRLEAESLHELANEFTDRKTESLLKVSEENDVLAAFGFRTYFVPGSPASDSLGNSAAGVKPTYFVGADL